MSVLQFQTEHLFFTSLLFVTLNLFLWLLVLGRAGSQDAPEGSTSCVWRVECGLMRVLEFCLSACHLLHSSTSHSKSGSLAVAACGCLNELSHLSAEGGMFVFVSL